MQNIEILDVFEILKTSKLLKCPKVPFVRSALICIIKVMSISWDHESKVTTCSFKFHKKENIFLTIKCNYIAPHYLVLKISGRKIDLGSCQSIYLSKKLFSQPIKLFCAHMIILV